ncbi:MAG: plastocyanin/azurin family copper-binding protein [Actinomycetota bacterium]
MTSTETAETDATDTRADAEADAPLESDAGGDVPFWHRPHVERYLTPLLLPIAIVAGVVFFAVNISRIFLSGHGHVSVIVGALITITIMTGASLLSAAPQMRTASVALIAAAFVAAVGMGGWLSLGHAELEAEGGAVLPDAGPASYELGFVSNNSLTFVPSEAEGETGIARVTLTNEGGQHTLAFEDTSVRFEHVEVAAGGDVDTSRAFFGEPGEYVFFCEIPGHREAGMEGVVVVDGEPVILETLEAELGGAEGGGSGEGEAPADAG